MAALHGEGGLCFTSWGGSFQTLGTDPAQGGIHKLQGPQSFLSSQSEHLVGTSCVLGFATGGRV